MNLPAGFFWDPNVALGQSEVLRLSDLAWPNYLRLESDIPEPGHEFRMSKAEFQRRFPIWGLRSESSGRLAAFAHGVLIATDLQAPNLPDDGWRFAIRAAAQSPVPNTLCLVVASVDPEARGLGLAGLLIERAKQATRDLGFTELIAPVRPMSKHQFPFESMDAYLKRTTNEGEPFDPWLKVHVRAGARLAGICQSSVRVVATLPKWREWTGLALAQSGHEILPGGLVPLEVDTAQNRGLYCEPNVWVRYRV